MTGARSDCCKLHLKSHNRRNTGRLSAAKETSAVCFHKIYLDYFCSTCLKAAACVRIHLHGTWFTLWKCIFFVSSAMLALVWMPRPNNKKETLKSSLITKDFTSEILAEVLFQLYIHLILTLRNQSSPFQPRGLLLQATLKSKRWCTESYCKTWSWRHRPRSSGCYCVAVL